VKTGCSVAESSAEGYRSKGALLALMMMIMMMIAVVMFVYSLQFVYITPEKT
jgi:hypothetical protein